MSARGDYVASRVALKRAVLQLLLAEHMIHLNASAAVKVKDAEDQVAIAARDLVSAVDELQPIERPKGYATT